MRLKLARPQFVNLHYVIFLHSMMHGHLCTCTVDRLEHYDGLRRTVLVRDTAGLVDQSIMPSQLQGHVWAVHEPLVLT